MCVLNPLHLLKSHTGDVWSEVQTLRPDQVTDKQHTRREAFVLHPPDNSQGPYHITGVDAPPHCWDTFSPLGEEPQSEILFLGARNKTYVAD
jgi:hypothetical protein